MLTILTHLQLQNFAKKMLGSLLVVVPPKQTKTVQNAVYMLSASWPSVPDSKYQLLKFRHEQKTNFKKLI